MDRTTPWQRFIALVVLGLAASGAIACDSGAPCDQCEPGSEFSWNPPNAAMTDRLKRFYAIGDEVETARGAGDDALVEALARESLELAAIYRCNWNHGNVIHDANRALGLVALARGDVDAAERFLEASGKSNGSPQLDSFGPELDLADALLQRGRTAAVVHYLKDVQRFWKDDGAALVDVWLAQIERGEKPRLNRFGPRPPRAGTIVLLVLLAAWPIVVTGGTAYAMRARIERPIAFCVTAILVGYGAAPVGVLLGARMMAGSLLEFPMGLLPALALPLAAVVLLSRLFVRRGERA
ncbi:MAG: hypothetical protein LW860_05965 [Xanthomonadaceae bacterium]|jgi:hypothetical protein|nr:hypothetical protein [Xanthomonadaceae bacterium]